MSESEPNQSVTPPDRRPTFVVSPLFASLMHCMQSDPSHFTSSFFDGRFDQTFFSLDAARIFPFISDSTFFSERCLDAVVVLITSLDTTNDTGLLSGVTDEFL